MVTREDASEREDTDRRALEMETVDAESEEVARGSWGEVEEVAARIRWDQIGSVLNQAIFAAGPVGSLQPVIVWR